MPLRSKGEPRSRIYAVTTYDPNTVSSREVKRFETIEAASRYASRHDHRHKYGLMVDYAKTPEGDAALAAARAAA